MPRLKLNRAQIAKLPGIGPTMNALVRNHFREPRAKRKPDLRPLEKTNQKAILSYLRNEVRCTWAVRVNSSGVKLPGRGGKAGFYRSNDRPGCPDILACVWGWFVAIECKREGEVPTVEQLACHADIERAGGVVIVATGVQDVQEWIERLA